MTDGVRRASDGWVTIRVPASAANLGPGYDTFGLALPRYDEIAARRIDSLLDITVDGQGAATVPLDASHLVIRATTRAFRVAGESLPGIEMRCRNTIPHGGGQGSSAAAIVAGVLLARALGQGAAARLTDSDVFALATEMEGHPDNVAPALYGGVTLAWMATPSPVVNGVASPGAVHSAAAPSDGVSSTTVRSSAVPRPRVLRLTPHPSVRVIVLTADGSSATAAARAALPATVPHGDAAANTARAALFAHAITTDPALLFDATEDWMHQRFREAVMPRTADVLRRLRARGLAAVLSGAGPAVLLLGADLPAPATIEAEGFTVETASIPEHGVTVNGRTLDPPARSGGLPSGPPDG